MGVLTGDLRVICSFLSWSLLVLFFIVRVSGEIQRNGLRRETERLSSGHPGSS
jgi:hypothetical protein